MYVLTATLTATNKAQQVATIVQGAANGFLSNNTHFQNMTVQYNGSHTMYLGDSAVSPTNGLVFSGGSSQPVIAANGPDNLLDYYIYGTTGDSMVFMLTP